MFRKMRLGSKMLFSFLMVGVLPFIIVGVASLQQASSALKEQSFSELRTAQNFKKKQLIEYFEAIRNDLEIFCSNDTLVNGLAQFTRAFNEEGIEGQRWGAFDAFYGPDINAVIEEYDYEEICFISADGDIVYSIRKSGDLGKNVVSDSMKSSALAEAFRKSEGQAIAFADVQPYPLAGGRPAGFMVGSVADEDGTWIGSMAIPLPMDGINHITLERSGLGQTGETYLVGPDFLMRSDSPVDPANHTVTASFMDSENGKVDTRSVRAALGGDTGQHLTGNYLGVNVLSTYEPLDVLGVRWAFVSEIEQSEAFGAVIGLRRFIVVIGILVLAGILFVAWLITRSIATPLNRSIGRLDEGANQVDSASTIMANASQSLANGASDQAASIEETSSALEEMSSMINRNADHAGKANKIMADAREIVERANESMSALTDSILEISRSSDETSKIVKTIDEIAFQTNLLALNAAVEAARAGEAGAGFAVVADEVRSLALRATEAARGTAALIEENVKRTRNGSELVSSTNLAFQQMSDAAMKADALVAEIASASKEQANGINHINTAVMEIDRKVQESAASAEESASASEEMNRQASDMKKIVKELMQIVGSGRELSTGPSNRKVAGLPRQHARLKEDREAMRLLPLPLEF